MVKNPVVDFRALLNRNFTVGCILSFITGIGMFATIYLTPLFLGYVRGFSAWQTGMAIFSTGLASVAGVPVYIMLAKRFDLRWIMLAGLLCFGAGIWSFSLVTSDWGWRQLLVPQLLRGFPQVFCVAPSVTLGLGSLPPERVKYASGLFNMMRNLGGAVGIALCGAILNDRTNFHFLVLSSNLSVARPQVPDALQGMAQALCGPQQALKELWRLTYTQAETMAYADAFYVIATAFAVAVCLAPLLRQVKPPAAPQANH